jgi:DNA ligase-1
MRRFGELYERLDATTSTRAKVEALVAYFAAAPPQDAAWAVFFLTGRRFKRLLTARQLFAWTVEATGLPDWLVAESYSVVGDAAETISLLVDRGLGAAEGGDAPLSQWVERRILPLRSLDDAGQRAAVLGWWSALPRRELFVLNKLLTGELRVGVSATLVVRALAQVAGVEPPVVSGRLMGEWEPSPTFFSALVSQEGSAPDASRPYPFCLAYPLEGPPESLGAREGWLVEWKWDGIRAQLIRRGGRTFLWSRGEELITDRFPEVTSAAGALPEGTVLDGEVLAVRDGQPLPFSVLQRRIGRQKLTARILQEAPAALVAYDLLEEDGEDLRARPLRERRARLERLLAPERGGLLLSEPVTEADWAALATVRAQARARGVEGFMLKHLGSPYHAGRRKGDWWKWKIDPYSVDAVLVYAQYGSGRRASLFTDYTFAVWHQGQLVPVAKAYSGLSDEEIAEVDRWIRANARERFGPVRAVEPVQVFELHFEAIARSPRHKSGVAVRFPRIARWRKDKRPEEADTLEQLLALIP